MAAAVARGGGAAVRRSSFLTGCNFLIRENPCIRTPVLWKQPLSRTFFSDRRKLHTAPVGQAFRLRPFHVLVATGGGYAGYKKYEGYKLEQLEKKGIELPVKLASEWEKAPTSIMELADPEGFLPFFLDSKEIRNCCEMAVGISDLWIKFLLQH